MQKKEEKTAENKSSRDNFFVHEIKERINIKNKSKEFKAVVDSAKEATLERVNGNYSQRNELISSEINQLEMALMSDDPEKIKKALAELSSLK